MRSRGQPPSGVLGAQGVTACLLENEPVSYFSVARLRQLQPEP